MKTSHLWIAAVAALFLMLQACASFQTSFDTPAVKLVSVKPLKSDKLAQRFEIGLRISNPNPIALPLVGISYDIALDAYPLVSGVSANLPSIEAYGEALVTVQASISLLQSVRFLASILKNPKDAVAYEIKAKLDTGLPLVGKVAVADAGEIQLTSH